MVFPFLFFVSSRFLFPTRIWSLLSLQSSKEFNKLVVPPSSVVEACTCISYSFSRKLPPASAFRNAAS